MAKLGAGFMSNGTGSALQPHARGAGTTVEQRMRQRRGSPRRGFGVLLISAIVGPERRTSTEMGSRGCGLLGSTRVSPMLKSCDETESTKQTSEEKTTTERDRRVEGGATSIYPPLRSIYAFEGVDPLRTPLEKHLRPRLHSQASETQWCEHAFRELPSDFSRISESTHPISSRRNGGKEKGEGSQSRRAGPSLAWMPEKTTISPARASSIGRRPSASKQKSSEILTVRTCAWG
eukprot:5602236-Pleurochrysis_carterae.AAC.1